MDGKIRFQISSEGRIIRTNRVNAAESTAALTGYRGDIMTYLKIENICKQFDGKEVLKGVNAEIDKGEFVCILGPSGCGKTTLLRIIAGLESADQGKVIIEGNDCTLLPPSKRNFGIVFQSYALFPNMTVETEHSLRVVSAETNEQGTAEDEGV